MRKERQFEFFKGSKSEESFVFKLPQEIIAKILNPFEYRYMDSRKAFEDKFKAKYEKTTENKVLFLNAFQHPTSDISKLARELVLKILQTRIRI